MCIYGTYTRDTVIIIMMSIVIFLLTLTVVAANGANLKSAVFSKDSTSQNYSTLETINDVVKDLINQTAFITAVANTTDAEKNETSAPLKIEQVGRNQRGILGFWTWHEITPTTKGLDADSLNEDIESEGEYSSFETESKNDQRNESSLGGVNSHYIPNFHLSIKIDRDDSYISENLALLSHLNRTIERLREFNDKYEQLVADNEAINNKNLQELKSNSAAALTKTNDDDVSTTIVITTMRTIELPRLSDNHSATPPINNDHIISGIQANLMA